MSEVHFESVEMRGGPMIDVALRLVAGEINGWFRSRRSLGLESGGSVAYPLDPVVASNLVEADGSIPIETEDKVVIVLTRIAEERNIRGGRGETRQGAEIQVQTMPIFLDLHVLVAARFRRYEAGLGVLSDVIGFLQSKPVFTHQNTPQMGDELDRLDFTMLKLDYGEQNHLWACLGAKYSPSAAYSVRLVPLGRPQLRERVPVVQETRTNGSSVPAA